MKKSQNDLDIWFALMCFFVWFICCTIFIRLWVCFRFISIDPSLIASQIIISLDSISAVTSTRRCFPNKFKSFGKTKDTRVKPKLSFTISTNSLWDERPLESTSHLTSFVFPIVIEVNCLSKRGSSSIAPWPLPNVASEREFKLFWQNLKQIFPF